MRVALLLHGHFRCWDRVWDGLKDNLIDHWQPDVFGFAWNDSMGNYLAPLHTQHPELHPGYSLDSGPVSAEYIENVKRQLSPKSLILENYMDHDANHQAMIDSWRWVTTYLDVAAGGHRPKGCLGMNWARSRVIKAKREYEQLQGWKYDWVIVTRWDVYNTRPITFHDLDDSMLNAAGGRNWHPWDYWTAGPSDQIDAWGEQWDGMQELMDAGKFNSSPHQWQTAWFEHRKIPWRSCDPGVGIAR